MPDSPTSSLIQPGEPRAASDAIIQALKGMREGGFQADAYPDANGWAIGYGMQYWQGKKVTPGMRVTQPDADAEFQRQLDSTYRPIVDRALKVPVTQDQYDALISMTWNAPRAATQIIQKLNSGQTLTPGDFQASATSQGKPNAGLSQRRSLEYGPFAPKGAAPAQAVTPAPATLPFQGATPPPAALAGGDVDPAGGGPAGPDAPDAPAQDATTPQSGRLLATNEFATRIRSKFNAYDTVPDDVLTHAFLQKYPVYGNRVVDVLQGADGVTAPPLGQSPTMHPGAPPAPPDLMSTGEKAASAVVDIAESPFTGAARLAKGVLGAQGFEAPGAERNPTAEEAATGVLPASFNDQGPEPPVSLEQAARPAADAIGGAMEMGTIPMIAGIALQPEIALPALGAGAIAAHGAGKVAEVAGAPPAVVEIAQNVAGLAAGGLVAHGIANRRVAAMKGTNDLIASAEADRAQVADTDLAQAESAMRGEFTDETGIVQGEQVAQHAATESTMRSEFADETNTVQNEQELEKLHAAFAFNEGLRQLAEAKRTGGVTPRSPFDYLDQVDTIAAAADGTIRDPNRLLPPRQPRAYSAEPPTADYLGVRGELAAEPPPDSLPGHLDAITQALEEGGLASPPPEAPPQLFDPRVGRPAGSSGSMGVLVDQVEQLLTGEGRPEPPAEPTVNRPLTDPNDPSGIYFRRRPRVENAKRFTPAVLEQLQSILGQMEALPYNPKSARDAGPGMGGDLEWRAGNGGASVYDDVLGEAPLNVKPDGSLPQQTNSTRDKLIGDVRRAIENRDIHNNVAEGAVRVAENLAEKGAEVPSIFQAEAPGDRPPTLVKNPVRPAAEGEAGAPPAGVEAPAAAADDLPDFLNSLEADPTAEGGYDEEGAVPHASEEAARIREQYGFDESSYAGARRMRDALEAMPESARAEPPAWWTELYNKADDALIRNEKGTDGSVPADEAPASTEPTFWDALKHDATKFVKDTEGSLRLTIGPDDEPGLRRWINNQRKAYGHEEWFQQAEDALEEGDHRSAYRIAAMASTKYQLAAATQARRDERAAPEGSVAQATATRAREAAEDVIDRAAAAHRKQVEAELGMPLPASVKVSPEGILTFAPGGKDVPALKARATDLTLARSLANDIISHVDPTQILRMGTSDEVEPQFQMSKQAADQVVREFDDQTIETLADLMGYQDRTPAEQRIEIGRQLSRTYSSAGRLLGNLGNWTQANEELMYQVGAVSETGAARERGSVGALQAMGITDPDGFVRWLGGKATPEDLARMRFELPTGVELKNAQGDVTAAAQRYAKNWFRRAQRLNEQQTTIDRIVGEQGSPLDRALAALTIAPKTQLEGGRGAALNGLSKAALISRPGTAIRNTISQTGRYGVGMADEAIAGTLSLATGNPTQATSHFRMMKYLAQGTARKGNNVLGLFKHPWADGLQATYDYTEALISTLPPEDMRKTLSLLSNLPHQELRFMGGLALDDTIKIEGQDTSRFRAVAAMQRAVDVITDPKVRNVLTIFNRVQEFAFRGAVFDAVMRHQIEAAGLDPVAELVGDPRGLIAKVGAPEFDRMAGAAVSASLDYTFAAEPMPGTAPNLLLDAFRKVPILSFALQMGQPFARFNFVSAPRWVWDHTPVAPLVDIPLAYARGMMGDESPMFRGRYSQMLQMRAQEKTMLDLTTQIARAKYDSATALSDFMASKSAAEEAGKVLKGIQGRASKSLPLEALQPHIDQVQGELTAAKEATAAARIKWKQADVRVKNLEQQEAKGRQTVQNLQAVGAAKSPQEYFARTMTGSAMMAAGWAFWKWKADHSTTPGSPDVEWYEFPTAAMPESAQAISGSRGQTVDLRAYAPEVQQLFPPQFLADVWSHTDWSEWDSAAAATDATHYVSEYMKSHYTGRYTSDSALKAAMEAYFSMSPAAGSTRDMLEIITGAGDSGKHLDLGSVRDGVLTMAGQYLGRFTSPLGAINDVVGQFSPEDAKARIPEEGTPASHSAAKLVGEPTLANIPGARRLIPEKVDALTGQPIAGVDPIARQLGGVTKRIQNRVRQELTATGTPYSAAVPRQTGDREFDNVVNEEYSKVLNDYMPDIFDNEVYQAASPELRRDILANGVPGESAIFPQLKKLAYQNAIDRLGDEYASKLESPEVAAKLQRWEKFIEQLDQELEPALHANADLEKEQEQTTPQEPGAPPGPIQF